MARSEARIFTSIWSDDDFRALPANAQRMYFLALSQPGLSLCGVVSYTPRRWAGLAADTTPRTAARDIATLVARRYVIVDDGTEELWIRSFIKRDGPTKNDNLIVALARDFDAINSKPIREGVTNAIAEGLANRSPNGPDDALVHRVLDRVGDGMLKAVAYAFPDGPLARVRARSPAPAPAPSPPLPATGSRSPHTADARAALRTEPEPADAAGVADAPPETRDTHPEPQPPDGGQPPGPCPRCDGVGKLQTPDRWVPCPDCSGTTGDAAPDPDVQRLTMFAVDAWRWHHQGWTARTLDRKTSELAATIAHLANFVDPTAIEEAIGRLGELDQPPRSAAYLHTTVAAWAAERHITVPDTPRPAPTGSDPTAGSGARS